MKLPNGKNAVIPPGKLVDYCLNPLHPDGKHKAKVFNRALGFTQNDHVELQKMILKSAIEGTVTNQQKNFFGELFRVEQDVIGINKKETLCSLWIIYNDSEIPSLTYCFIKTKR